MELELCSVSPTTPMSLHFKDMEYTWLVFASLWRLVMGENFLYFAYGSNLLADRIHINNPSAKFVGPVKLGAHRLDFIMNTAYWRGAVATIAPDARHDVWGALWKLNVSNLDTLDRQELVNENGYFAKTVTVKTKQDREIAARTYEQTVKPQRLAPKELLPVERRPSLTYLKVMIKGAIESGLPEYYIRYLYSVPHNGRDASLEVLKQIDLDSICLYPNLYSQNQQSRH